MKNSNTSQRLRYLMDRKGLRQVDILEAAEPYCIKYGIKMGKNALSQYVSGKVEPGQEKLSILGMALGVSEVWLMGYDVPMERSAASIIIEDEGRTRELLDLLSLLTPDQLDLIIRQIKGILSGQ